jgi:hypothetical protein
MRIGPGFLAALSERRESREERGGGERRKGIRIRVLGFRMAESELSAAW